MGDPLTIVSTALQAIGLGASIFGQSEAEKEAERQAKERARSQAWTNLVSVAGGGGPLGVPDATPAFQTNTFQQIGQVASGLGQMAGSLQSGFEAKDQQSLENALLLASKGIDPDLTDLPDNLQGGFAAFAEQSRTLKDAQISKLLQSAGGVTPAAKANMLYGAVNAGAVFDPTNPPPGAEDIPAFWELVQAKQEDADYLAATRNIYEGDDPNLIKINNMAAAIAGNKVTASYKPMADVGSFDAGSVPEGAMSDDQKKSLNVYNEHVQNYQAADLALKRNKASGAGQGVSVKTVKIPELQKEQDTIIKLTSGGKIDQQALVDLATIRDDINLDELTKVLSGGAQLPEALKRQLEERLKIIGAELDIRFQEEGTPADAIDNNSDPLGIF